MANIDLQRKNNLCWDFWLSQQIWWVGLDRARPNIVATIISLPDYRQRVSVLELKPPQGISQTSIKDQKHGRLFPLRQKGKTETPGTFAFLLFIYRITHSAQRVRLSVTHFAPGHYWQSTALVSEWCGWSPAMFLTLRRAQLTKCRRKVGIRPLQIHTLIFYTLLRNE